MRSSLKKQLKKGACFLLSAAMVVSSFTVGSYVNEKEAQAFIQENVKDLDDTTKLNADLVGDATLLRVMQVLVNYEKETGEAISAKDNDLTTSAYDVYAKEAPTVKEAMDFDGVADFSNYTGIKSITGVGFLRGASEIILPETISIPEIAAGEFYSCKATKIIIPASVSKIGAKAVSGCTNLVTFSKYAEEQNVLDLNGITSVGASAFEASPKLNNIMGLPNGFTIGDNAFKDCKALEKVDVSMITDYTKLGAGAFSGCSNLTYAKLNSALASIPDGLFSDTGELTVEFTDKNIKATKIGENCFYGSKISEFDVSNFTNLEIVGNSAFYGSKLENFDASKCYALTAIGRGAFAGSMVQEVKLPSGLTSLGDSAFKGAMLLQSINIPSGVELIDAETFYGTALLEEGITFDDASQSKLAKIEKLAFTYSGITNTDFLKGLKNLKEVCDYAFARCYAESIYLPASVETIGISAFAQCTNLKTLDLNDTAVTELQGFAASCHQNAIPTDVLPVSNEQTPLNTVYLPKNIETIAGSAFRSDNSLSTVSYNKSDVDTFNAPNSLKVIGEYAFSETGLKKINFPDESVELIGPYAFNAAKSLTEVKLSKTLVTIEERAFDGCDALMKLEMFDGLVTIGNYAFNTCSSLTLSTGGFPNTLETIGDYAFAGDLLLVDENELVKGKNQLSFPSSLKSIGSHAFYRCSPMTTSKQVLVGGITQENILFDKYILQDMETPDKDRGLKTVDFTFAKNLERIGDSAFDTNSLERADLSATKITTVERNLFANNYSLEVVTFPDTVTLISEGALSNVPSLKTITVPASANTHYNFLYTFLNSDDDMSEGETTSANWDRVSINISTPSEPTIIALQREVELPVNIMQNDVINGSVSFNVIDKDDNDKLYTLSTNSATLGVGTVYNGGDNCPVVITQTGANPNKYSIKGVRKGNYVLNISAGYLFNRMIDPSNKNYSMFDKSITMSYNLNITDIPAESITLQNDNIIESSGKNLYLPYTSTTAVNEFTLEALVDPMDVTVDPVWETDSSVITVSDATYDRTTGKLTAKVTATDYASATLKISYDGKTLEQCTLHTVERATDISYSFGSTNNADTSITYAVNSEDKITATASIADENATAKDEVRFISSDEKVVTVDDNGNVKAVGQGSATITIKSTSGSIVKEIAVEVADANYVPDTNSVVIDENTPTKVIQGSTITLNAKVYPAKASQNVTWSVSDEKIATISGNVLTAVSNGKVTVTATNDGGQTATIDIEVVAKLTGIQLINGQIAVGVGDEVKVPFTANTTAKEGIYVTDGNFGENVEVTSSDETIATVTYGSKTITIKGVKQGEVTITVKGLESGETYSFKVKIYTKLTKLSLSGANTVAVGNSTVLLVTKEPADSTEDVVWKSSSEDIATVDANGTVTGKKAGKATITASAATTSGVSATYEINVTNPAKKLVVKTKTANNKKIYMVKGTSTAIGYNVNPKETTDTITYKSNKAKVAAIDENGTITANRPGKAVVTVKASSGKAARVKIFVLKRAKKAKKVIIRKPKAVKVGKTAKLTIKIKAANATGDLSFASSDTSKLTVDEFGYITGVAKGKSKVTVTAANGRKASKVIRVK